MTDLHALAERLEKATGADREIDALLDAWAYELDSDAQADIVCDSDNVERGHYWVSIDGGRTLYSSAPLTSSLDAAVALCERCECDVELCLLAAMSALHGAPMTADKLARQVCLVAVKSKIAEQAND